MGCNHTVVDGRSWGRNPIRNVYSVRLLGISMEGISMDGVVEIGHDSILKIAHGHASLATTRADNLLLTLFGGTENTIVWRLKDNTWMMWNVTRRHIDGPNHRAIQIAVEQSDLAFNDEIADLMDTIGGYVVVMNEEEASIILDCVIFEETIHIPYLFLLRSRRNGGVGVLA